MIKLRYPVNYITITNEYKNSHQALDLGWHKNHGGKNQNIYSPYDGKITNIIDGKNNNIIINTAGNLVMIKHDNEVVTRLIHLEKNTIVVKVGDNVKTGDIIAKMGNSGYAFGHHLHYDVYINNKKVNPINYTYVYEGQTISENSKVKNQILYYKEEDQTETIYTVKKNDTLSQIGKLYNITYQELAEYNDIKNPHLIRVGQKIKIPNSKYNLMFLLKEGSKGKAVEILQLRLNNLGSNLLVDGIFGKKTKAAVKEFQKKNNLLVDGIVGINTSHSLDWLYKSN